MVRSLSLVPLLLRVEDAEHEDRDRWIARARERFESLFEELYQLPRCDLSAYFEDVRVSHESYYAYGERIAALLEPSRTGMTRAFSQLLPFLSGHPPWAARALRPPPQGRGMLRALIACADVDMDARVMPLLRRLVRLGIRSQIAAQEGVPWSDLVEQAAARPRDLVVLAFWSQEAQTDPVFLERYAQALRHGMKPISVQLDAGAPRTYAHAPGVLPEPGLAPPSLLSAQDEAHLVILIARHVFRQTELDRREELVLYLGHRQSQSDPLLPVSWRHLPALDMRADLLGSRDFCPTLTEWRQLREDAQALKDLLPAARNLYVCGLAPLGVGAIIGHTWDRGTGVTLLTHARSPDSGDQEWSSSLSAADLEATGVWEPERGEQIRLAPSAEPIRAAHLLLALLPAARAEYISNVRRWNETRSAPYSAVGGEGPAQLLWLQTPIAITKPTQMRDVLRETLGALHYLRRTYPFIFRLDLVTALPLAAVSLLGHHLRQFGELNFYDQVLATAEYRLAVQFH